MISRMRGFAASVRVRRGLAAGALVGLAGLAWVRLGPLPPGLLEIDRAASTVVLDRHGEVLYETLGDAGGKSMRVMADALPETVVAATLAAEDKRFWRHPGIDPIAIGRAVAHDLRRGATAEGGSTITQQTAKLLLARDNPRRRRTLSAKLEEAVVALRLEHRLAKREILALYLSLAPYGNQLVGVERASREYFDRRAADTTPAEAAFLAALPQRPSTFNPLRSLTRARARQRLVLHEMARNGTLTPALLAESLQEQLTLRREPGTFIAPHFVERVLANTAPPRGGRIVSSLDAALQRDVRGILRSARPTLERHGAHNVAVVVLDNHTGGWLAWEGSGDHSDSLHGGAIDGVVSPRQPGSALKPFTYALAFETGASPATVLPDVPSSFPTAEPGVVYRPANYDGRFRGPLRARAALAGSENLPAVLMASRVGVPDLLRFLRRAGITTLDKSASYYGLGVTLGDAEVRLDELVTAYSAFARGGVPIAPTFLAGGEGASHPRMAEALVSERTAFWISDILSDGDARAYAFGRDSALDFPFPVAAKTGTSQAYRDNWALGFTRDVTVGVWVGNFDRQPLTGSSGVTGAAPIFHAVMLAATEKMARSASGHDELPTSASPVATERRLICALSGEDAGEACPSQVEEWMPIERPRERCDWHRVGAATSHVAWPPEYLAWAHDRGLVTADAVARAGGASEPRQSDAGFRIINPAPGSTYLIDPTLRPEFQTLGLRASTAGGGRIEWAVDGRSVGAGDAHERFEWPLAPGAHRIAASDRQGRRSEVSILVK